MPRTKRDKPSVSGLFKQYFAERPDLLEVSSLDEVINRYHQENPNADASPQLRQIAANVKSAIKRASRQAGHGPKPKRGRPRKPAAAAAPASPGPTAPRGSATLERLEERIDDCIAAAKEIDRRGMIDVIRLLRRALNGVVIRIEET